VEKPVPPVGFEAVSDLAEAFLGFGRGGGLSVETSRVRAPNQRG